MSDPNRKTEKNAKQQDRLDQYNRFVSNLSATGVEFTPWPKIAHRA